MKRLQTNIKVGFCGRFTPTAFRTVSARILSRLTQIDNYCKIHKVKVCVFIVEGTPIEYYQIFKAKGLSVFSVIKSDVDKIKLEGRTILTPSLQAFFNKCDVTFVVDTKSNSERYDTIENKELFIVSEEKDYLVTQSEPSLFVKNFDTSIEIDSDPYGSFFHEPLIDHDQENYYERITTDIPDFPDYDNRD